MASVSLAPATGVIDQPLTSAPAWWRQAHSYSVPVVVSAQIATTWLAVKLAQGMDLSSQALSEGILAAMIGFIFAQCFLLGIWAALGGLATIPRWLIVGSVYVLGSLAVAVAAYGPSWESIVNNAPEIVILGGVLTFEFAAVLLPLRRLAGWRVDFDAAYHRPAARRRGQLALMDFAAMFCAVALPLTLGRVLIDAHGDDGANLLVFMGIFGLIVAATAAPLAYAVLAGRRWFWFAGAAIWVVGISWCQSLLVALAPDLNLFDTSASFLGLHLGLVAFHVGISASIAVPIGALRLCGLELLVMHGR
jgi:hypothetical protein